MKITGALARVLRHVHIEALRLVAAVGHVAHQAHAGRHVLARRTGVAVVERGVIGGPGGAARFDPVAQGGGSQAWVATASSRAIDSRRRAGFITAPGVVDRVPIIQ
ncbi:hypothetical protein LP419_14855 [Massilia sp. H-1]|nr:hypothetical protein LP419_14855 [Massilia sp. H-1]